MRRAARSGLACLVMGVSVAIPACLESLPPPAACPAPAQYPMCTLTNPPNPPDPNAPPGNCDCPGRDCMCNNVDPCKRTKASCYPAPDCPPTVRRAVSGAQCLEATPSMDLSDLGICSCGCVACATACDGEGVVWGQSQQVGFALSPSLPGAGSLGIMIRARGSGALGISLNPPLPDLTLPMLDPVTLTPEFADSISSTTYSWASTAGRPTSILLITDATSSAEVDCVVPYLAP